MKKAGRVLSFAMFVLFGTISVCGAVGYRITQLTDNTVRDVNAQINDNGHVVWQSGDGSNDDIYLFDGSSVTNISNNPTSLERYPQINDNGYVVWQEYDGADEEVFVYNGSGVINISNDPSRNDIQPQINDSGYVVWQGWDSANSNWEVFLYDGSGVSNISNDPAYNDTYPQINDNGHVVWGKSTTSTPGEIFYYDGASVTNISNSSDGDFGPQINNNGYVVWQATFSTYDMEILLYDGSIVTNISNNPAEEKAPQINENNQVVWYGCNPPSDYVNKVFFYDGASVMNLSEISSNGGLKPQINNAGHVVWWGSNTPFYDGVSVTDLSNTPGQDREPQINNNSLVVWEGYEGESYEIFLAEPIGSATAASKDLQITIPGSGCFSILIENTNSNNITVSPSINWTHTAPADVTFAGGSVSVPAGQSQSVNRPCFEVGSGAQPGDYQFDILWTGSDSGGNSVVITTDPTLHLVYGSAGLSVGGTAFMADKMALLAPWMALAALILLGGGTVVVRRIKKNRA